MNITHILDIIFHIYTRFKYFYLAFSLYVIVFVFLLFMFGSAMLFKASLLSFFGTDTTGIIIAVEPRACGLLKDLICDNAKVRYQTREGREIIFSVDYSPESPFYQEGQVVSVVYSNPWFTLKSSVKNDLRGMWTFGFFLIILGFIMLIPLNIKLKISSFWDFGLKFYNLTKKLVEEENRFYFGIKAIYRGEKAWKNLLMASFCLIMTIGLYWAGFTGLEGYPITYYYLSGIFFLSAIYYIDSKDRLRSSTFPLLIFATFPIFIFLGFFYFFILQP